MNFKNIVAALVLGVAGSASAAVLTFDDLTGFVYGDGAPLLSSMGYNGQSLTYQESGPAHAQRAVRCGPYQRWHL